MPTGNIKHGCVAINTTALLCSVRAWSRHKTNRCVTLFHFVWYCYYNMHASSETFKATASSNPARRWDAPVDVSPAAASLVAARLRGRQNVRHLPPEVPQVEERHQLPPPHERARLLREVPPGLEDCDQGHHQQGPPQDLR